MKTSSTSPLSRSPRAKASTYAFQLAMPLRQVAIPQKGVTSLSLRRTSTVCVGQRLADANNGDSLHPVLQVLKQRMETGSKPGRRKDTHKVALCIEGGGMRGAVSAGMVAALKYIGLEDVFDVVYGCSAGAIVGAYFISRQLPVYGAQIYYDTICSVPENGEKFIDLWALRHHPYWRLSRQNRKLFYGEGARPVLLLDRLIDDVMQEQCPLDWEAFQKMNQVQPLKPVASSLFEMRSHTFDSFRSFPEFLQCLRASARVPGIAGNPVEIDGQLFADGLLFEPIPYRSALQDGCTDVLVLRTKPDSYATRSLKPGVFEKHIARPYFNKLPRSSRLVQISEYLLSGGHIELYDSDIELLREGNLQAERSNGTAIFSVTPPIQMPEMNQLESRAAHVYSGVRDGFAAAYDTLSPFATRSDLMSESGDGSAGEKVSRWVFPDDELNRVEEKHRESRRKKKRWNKRRQQEQRARHQVQNLQRKQRARRKKETRRRPRVSVRKRFLSVFRRFDRKAGEEPSLV